VDDVLVGGHVLAELPRRLVDRAAALLGFGFGQCTVGGIRLAGVLGRVVDESLEFVDRVAGVEPIGHVALVGEAVELDEFRGRGDAVH
jgi:hypothetical protein